MSRRTLNEALRACSEARKQRMDEREKQGRPLWGASVWSADRDRAMQAALENAPEAWKARVVETVERLARERDQFTADNVWDELDRLGDDGTLVYEPRALGAILLECARRKVVKSTGTYAPSRRRRGSPISFGSRC